jgi:tripartite-type tricarboxylate transporter receptor subunit TctC
MRLAKSLCTLFLAAVIGGMPGGAAAQDYPARLIRIILPFTPAGSSDVYARVLAGELQAAWGKSVVVENRPGATGVIGSDLVRQSPADGYTLLFTSNTAHVLGPLLMEPRPFDAVADFTPVSKVVKFPLYLIVHPSVPIRTVGEFIAFARARPDQFNYSSSGQGGGSHLVAELFNSAAGIRAGHVPYKGAAPALQSVLSGEAQYLFNNIGTSHSFVKIGKLRGLAVTGDKRSPALPDTVTLAEAGVRGLENAYTWLGMLAPPKLPAAILGRLNAEVVRIMHSPDVEKRVLNDGYQLVANTPAQFAGEMQAEIATWSRVIREKGIKAE